ncbi:hypothetical protein Y032_0021g375 [Ancylostoma ceylanicum]|uniref:Reverse transcriptase domain-containing protein n=1 Tax=Ancylostoma ceylanicum TaxID=53326 RepID=A0A016V111_9BILA|nr:hypothetical protein Y032_0021g375 [Ancylostoma ceylanicum]
MSQAAASTSADFPISVGVRQASALSSLLFIVVMEVVTRDLQKIKHWTLLYADEVMLAPEDKQELERLTEAWNYLHARFGLRRENEVSNNQRARARHHKRGQLDTINVDGVDLPRADVFKYLGSGISSDGSLCHGIVRVNSARRKDQRARARHHKRGQLDTINVDGVDLPRADVFKYLGSGISSDGSLCHGIVRVNSARRKERLLTRVLYGIIPD